MEVNTEFIDLYEKLAVAEQEVFSGAEGEDYLLAARQLRGCIHGRLSSSDVYEKLREAEIQAVSSKERRNHDDVMASACQRVKKQEL